MRSGTRSLSLLCLLLFPPEAQLSHSFGKEDRNPRIPWIVLSPNPCLNSNHLQGYNDKPQLESGCLSSLLLVHEAHSEAVTECSTAPVLVLGSEIHSQVQGHREGNEQGRFSSCPECLLYGLSLKCPHLTPSLGRCVRMYSLAGKGKLLEAGPSWSIFAVCVYSHPLLPEQS